MAGLGLGLGISSGVNGPGHSSGVVSDFLYLLAQNGDVLQAQKDLSLMMLNLIQQLVQEIYCLHKTVI